MDPGLLDPRRGGRRGQGLDLGRAALGDGAAITADGGHSATWAGFAARVGLIALAYLLLGAFGLQFAHVEQRVTLVWAPTGLAIAALALLGLRHWPGVWLGAFAVNLTPSLAPGAAAVIALGNTLEALAGAALLLRLGFDPAMTRTRDALAVLAALALAVPLSAGVGAGALCLLGNLPLAQAGVVARVWAAGDFLGGLIVLPLLATFSAGPRLAAPGRTLLEAAALGALIAAAAALAVGVPFAAGGYPLGALPLPLVVLAAMRHGPRGASAASLVLVVSAGLLQALRLGGAVDARSVHEGVALLWTFIAITAGTALVIASTVAERSAAVLALRRLVERREQVERALRRLVEGTAAPTSSEAFFLALVRHLAEELRVEHAAVTDGRLRPLAAWSRGAARELDPAGRLPRELDPAGPLPRELDPAGPLPRELDPAGPLPRELELGPGDPAAACGPLRAAFGAAECLAVPLTGADGRAVGALAVLDGAPLADPALARDLLAVCAPRAAAELERVEHDRERRRLEAQVFEAQKLESIGVLAGGVAHDFNNLLVGVLGNASVAQGQVPPDSPARATLQRIEVAGRRAAELTQQLLAYAGRGRVSSGSVDLSALVREMSQLLAVSLSKKAALSHELADDLPPVEGDATQLRQIVMNLLTNASDALGDAPGRISVRTGLRAVGRAELEGAPAGADLPAGDYVFVEVTDSGRGMDAATLARMYEPFFTTKATGRGLGLSATLGIVRAHGGAITVDSRPGEGSTFRVFFSPGARRGAAAAAVAERPPRRATGTALVVDDEPVVRDMATTALTSAGFEVVTAVDGRDALEVHEALRGRLTVVLLDLAMPRLGGQEVLRELRRQGSRLPVVVISGYTTWTSTEEDGPVRFLPKPFTRDELLRAIDEVLQG